MKAAVLAWLQSLKPGFHRWLLQNLVAWDQVVCAFFGGWADETVSSYAFRLERQGKWAGRIIRPVVDFIARRFKQQNHCADAYQAERDRSQLPPELRANTPTGLPEA